jgi:CheY-like chemotaxis protein
MTRRTAEQGRAPPPARPTILVVEDEVLVRFVLAEHLRDCGYKVVEAGGAAEAVTVLEAGVPVDLVFTDVQMPGAMDGFGLSRWVRQHHPEVRVVLTSGHTQLARQAGELCHDGPFLPKPYDPLRVEVLAHAAEGRGERSSGRPRPGRRRARRARSAIV